jgi:hypothetical protein
MVKITVKGPVKRSHYMDLIKASKRCYGVETANYIGARIVEFMEQIGEKNNFKLTINDYR